MTELRKITQQELDEMFATKIKTAGIKEQEFHCFHFKNVDASNLDFSKKDCKKMKFENVDLTNADFSHVTKDEFLNLVTINGYIILADAKFKEE
jgi:uncharacterized protein YjbI with pentapeptide repeats